MEMGSVLQKFNDEHRSFDAGDNEHGVVENKRSDNVSYMDGKTLQNFQK